MRILSRYVLRLLLPPFLLGAATVVFLFLLQFLMKYIDQLVGKGLTTWIIAQLITLNLAWMVVLAVPMGILVATLMVYGNLGATHELTAVKAAGGSPWHLLRAPFVISILLTLALFWFNDRVLPDANHRAKVLLYDIQRKKPTFALTPGQFYQGIEGYSILARRIDSVTNWLYGVTIYENRFPGQSAVLSADSALAQFTGDFRYIVLQLYNGEIHQYHRSASHRIRKIVFSQHKVYLDASGFLFSQTDEERFVRGDRELSIAAMEQIVQAAMEEHRKAMQKFRAAVDQHLNYLLLGVPPPDTLDSGVRKPIVQQIDRDLNQLQLQILSPASQAHAAVLRANRYRVEIQKKYAIPAACIVFALIGGSLGMLTRRGNFGISAAISLGFYILYWALLIGGEKLADRGIIPPWIGMWSANILIGIGGIVVLWRVMNEHWKFRSG